MTDGMQKAVAEGAIALNPRAFIPDSSDCRCADCERDRARNREVATADARRVIEAALPFLTPALPAQWETIEAVIRPIVKVMDKRSWETGAADVILARLHAPCDGGALRGAWRVKAGEDYINFTIEAEARHFAAATGQTVHGLCVCDGTAEPFLPSK